MSSQGKGSSGLTLLSGERSLVSRRFGIVIISVGSFVIRHISGSQMEERLVSVLSFCSLPRNVEVFNIDLRASLSFFYEYS